ncbi:MAG: aquaporin [Cellulomonadaceae bacterium]|jgi:aquaporin Z|nr:aquaporin [Cellulomonadaceae bacterium]
MSLFNDAPPVGLADVYATPADDTTDVPGTATHTLAARLGAEAFGTFMIVLGIIGVTAFNALNQNSTLVVALTAGFMLLAAVATVGAVSGGHFNPAVSLGAAVAGTIKWADAGLYVIAQIVGGIAAAFITWAVIPATFPTLLVNAQMLTEETRGAVIGLAANGFGAQSPLSVSTHGASEFSLTHALLLTIIVSGIFVGIILGASQRAAINVAAAADSGRVSLPYSPAVGGVALTAVFIIAWPVTNGAVNPASSIGTAIFAGSGDVWSQLWLFVVAPLAGGVLAALFVRAFGPTDVASVDGDFFYAVDDDDDSDEDDSDEDIDLSENAVQSTADVQPFLEGNDA